MDMRAGSLNPLRGCCTCTQGQGVCNGETVTFTTSQTREVFLRCAPTTLSGAAGEQAAKFYECLPRKLEECGVRMSDVVWERIFFRNAAADFEAFGEARRNAYARAGVCGDRLPAATYIEQPPCRLEQAFELQVYALAAHEWGTAPRPLIPADRPGRDGQTRRGRGLPPSVHHQHHGSQPGGCAGTFFSGAVGRHVRHGRAAAAEPRHDFSAGSPHLVLSRRHRSRLRRVQSVAQRFLQGPRGPQAAREYGDSFGTLPARHAVCHGPLCAVESGKRAGRGDAHAHPQ